MAFKNVIPGTDWVVIRNGVQGVTVRRIVAWGFDDRDVGTALIANQVEAKLEEVTNDGNVKFKHIKDLTASEQTRLLEASFE
ncbi:hypothetical protein D3C86_1087110 [compost metagenome]